MTACSSPPSLGAMTMNTTWPMAIKSAETGEPYTLTVHPSGEIACSCGDFLYRRRFGHDECKHIREWKANNLAPGSSRPGRVIDDPALFR